MLHVRFDTRNVKPKVWGMAMLAVAAAAAVAVFAVGGADDNALAISIVLDVLFLASIAILVWAFFEQLKYNPYSYNTIYYLSFSFFLLSVLATHAALTVKLITVPDRFSGQNFIQIISLLTISAKAYMLYSFPFILALSAALCISNAVLMRREGARPVNLLGILLSLLLLGGELFIIMGDDGVSGSEQYVRIHDLITNILAALYLYFECMVIGMMIANAIVSRYEPEKDKDYVIILGCAIRKDGTPTPLLKGRIERAIAFRNAQLEETGKELTFITSGGKGANEVISESESMKQYLISRGIPEGSIIEENRSTSTLENMKFSKEIIYAHGPAAKVIFSTTNYHVFRSGLCARRIKMRAVGIGAKAKWYFWPNALVRELVGLLTEHRGKQALIITGLIVAYAALSLVKC